jgi:hypothetical protein
MISFSDTFTHVSNWNVSPGIDSRSNGQKGIFNSTANTTTWIEIFSNQPTISILEEVLIEVRYKSTANAMVGMIFGTNQDDVQGNYTFLTESFVLDTTWTIGIWNVSDRHNYYTNNLECFGFRFISPVDNWSLSIDYINLYTIEEHALTTLVRASNSEKLSIVPLYFGLDNNQIGFLNVNYLIPKYNREKRSFCASH